jgi:hypothetical protein
MLNHSAGFRALKLSYYLSGDACALQNIYMKNAVTGGKFIDKMRRNIRENFEG